MTVGVITDSASQKSGARSGVEFAASFSRLGIRTILYAYAESQDPDTLSYLAEAGVVVRMVRTSKRWSRSAAAAKELLSLLRTDRPDVLSLHARLPFAFAARRSRIPRVQTYYGTQFNALHERVFPWQWWLAPVEWLLNAGIWLYAQIILSLATTVVAMNQYTVREGFRRHGIRMSAIPLGATTPCIQPTGRPVPPHPFMIFTISRFTPYKNFHLIIEAFRRLQRDVPDARCVIAGIPERSAYLAFLKRYSPPNVEFKLQPSDAELVNLYESCDVYVTADTYLFFGLPVAEAAAFGKPIVAWDFAAAREMVRHGETGYVENNIESFAARLRQLAEDPSLRVRLGAAGRVRVQREFSWEQCAKAYIKLFEALRKP